jgi:manganese transport protein
MSQVVLSLALPFPMAALVWFTCRTDVMGSYKNRTLVKITAIVAAFAVLALNMILLVQTFGVDIPGLPSV